MSGAPSSIPSAPSARAAQPSARAYLTAALVLPAAAMATLVPHRLLWGRPLHEGLIDRGAFAFPVDLSRWAIVLVFAVSLGMHELLHAVGYVVFGRVPWRRIELVVRLSQLLVFVRCHAPLSRRAYVRSLLLPAVVLGVLPAVVGIATGLGWLTFYGFILLVMASGDIRALWLTRGGVGGPPGAPPRSRSHALPGPSREK
ncbi:DUF3267 domain-containing protein [Sorangium sp. So ce363]|uniref:DUF3267 domain-containing protein n=1 Tax=Sorangium sp. So ce363 TaxID=3133304 RepID=UPI003F60868C